MGRYLHANLEWLNEAFKRNLKKINSDFELYIEKDGDKFFLIHGKTMRRVEWAIKDIFRESGAVFVGRRNSPNTFRINLDKAALGRFKANIEAGFPNLKKAAAKDLAEHMLNVLDSHPVFYETYSEEVRAEAAEALRQKISPESVVERTLPAGGRAK